MNYVHHFRWIVLIALIAAGLAQAGTRGKISGRIVDASTDEPVQGVNVFLQGTTLGAATGEDGRFLILNVPPGVYTLVAHHIGFEKQEVRQLKVETNLTARVDLSLSPTALESGESIVIVADRPLIRKDVTSKLAIVDGAEIAAMPVESFEGVVANQAGITSDADGELHFRGGRSNEVAFLIDGQPVENPIDNSFGGLIDNNAIRELQVLSGTFNAEYGSALSGVVNIVTNEGSEKIKAKLEYTSPRLNSSRYRKANALVQDANPFVDSQSAERLQYRSYDALDVVDPVVPFEGIMNGFVSGPLPVLGHYFVSGEYKNENGWLPQTYDFKRSVFGKITLPINGNKINAIIQYSDHENQPYDHRYKYLPGNQGRWNTTSVRGGLLYNHVFNERSFFTAGVSVLDHESRFSVGDLDFTEYIFSERDENLEFAIRGNSKTWSDFQSRTWNAKFDWLIQLNQNHEFKTGIDANLHQLDVFDYSKEGENEDEFFLNEYQKDPVTASVYAQDKIEYDDLIINAGMRFDYVDTKSEALIDIENPFLGTEDSDPETKLSPRVGIAYPVTENTVFHFSYGHFFQFPDFQEIYRNLQFLQIDELSRARFPLVANPNVKSQKIIAYEFGVSQRIGDHFALNVSAYSRDINDLLGTIPVENQIRYVIFTNNDFARIQGIDVSLEKRMQRYWAARLDYSYAIARGNEASPTEEAFNIFEGREKSVKEFFLDFDRRHDIAFSLTVRTPKKSGFSFSGFHPVGDMAFSVLANFSSGLPYTPISDDRTKLFEKNSARMPWTNSVDIRAEKFFAVGGINASYFLEATNIFDRLNPVFVQPRTGKVWDDGKSELFGSGDDFEHDPSNVGPPRIIRLGLSVSI